MYWLLGLSWPHDKSPPNLGVESYRTSNKPSKLRNLNQASVGVDETEPPLFFFGFTGVFREKKSILQFFFGKSSQTFFQKPPGKHRHSVSHFFRQRDWLDFRGFTLMDINSNDCFPGNGKFFFFFGLVPWIPGIPL